MNILLILNDPAYGTERSFNGLRMAMSLSKRNEVRLKLFLMADAVACGKSGQNTPNGYYNIERMLKGLNNSKTPIAACGSCMDARGISESDLIEGVHRGSMDELTEWTLWAEKIIAF